MNRQGKGKIEWTDWTWNPVTGCKSTREQCAVRDVCYARRISERFGRSFEPTLHPERLGEPSKLKKPSKIFVCSMGELFGPWVPREWQEAVIKVARENPQHAFQFLTKFPHHIHSKLFPFPDNAWLGVTVNDNDTSRIGWLRAAKDLQWAMGGNLLAFVSAEPLLGPIHGEALRDINWLIIGAQTSPNLQPEDRWINWLLQSADWFKIPVFMKSNLAYEPKRREFPSHRGGRR